MENKEEINKYLAEAMGYTDINIGSMDGVIYARADGEETRRSVVGRNGFYSWDGFGKLWEWSQQQDWFIDFVLSHGDGCWEGDGVNIENTYECLDTDYINPTRLAEAVYAYTYTFLKERSND